ncbi:class I SAM-dependent methyltransferase [Herbiconiux liangxiaofengii]|uniref:class I SAM-dependent methyltransferase n=1 Tax=Herbiconiux liangxiaofengii TaxID=3342795 RepID=UPI0035B7010C
MTEPENTNQDAIAFWENRYQERPQIWSGKANAALVAVASSLIPGRALDLGSGEGGDSIWLAEQGWTVTGIDISTTALARAAEHAASRSNQAHGAGRELVAAISWQQADLAEWQPTEEFDLVSACFLHSPVAFPREEVLRRAAQAVAPGGHLLVVGHASFPSAHQPHHDEPPLPTPDEVVESLQLAEGWTTVLSETRSREATGPDGQPMVLDDAIVLVRRAAGVA